MNVDISVVICTRNRCEGLQRTLQTFCNLEPPPDSHWELVIVDNNSQDDTPNVCECFTQKLPLRHFFEPKQGQSAARNRGIFEANGQFVVFTDDDVDVDKHWICSLFDAARRNPDASFFGGRILPRWEKQPPIWLEHHTASSLRGVAVHLDLGENERFITEGDGFFFGANMAYRKDVFTAGNRFREDLGLNGNLPTRGEETELMRSLIKHKQRGYYVPSAIVYHRNPPERMTEKYVRKWFIGSGITKVRLGEVDASEINWFGAPRYLWRDLLESWSRYVLSRRTRRAETWLPYEISMAETWGMITEFRRVAKGRPPAR